MTKQHIATLLSAFVLFGGLYFGFNTKPKERKAIERSREIQGESTSFATLLDDAQAHLSPAEAEKISAAMQKLENAGTDTEKTTLLKSLSGQWYTLGNLPLAGGYAEQVAEIENADSSWSVAGATFFEGLLQAETPEMRNYCANHAVKAFESAASLNPENVQHRVNLALVYAENPPPDKPMTAALMLRDLAEKHPNNPAPFNALGRLAIKTGQWQRAIERLEHSWSLDKNNPNTPCLLAKAYEGMGNAAKAAEFAKICK